MTLRNRSILLRHLLSLSNITPLPLASPITTPISTREATIHIITILSLVPTLETILHKPLRKEITLYLPPHIQTEDTPTPNPDLILKCCNEHRVATRLTIRHANYHRYANYGSALSAMFMKKSIKALESIFKTASDRTSKTQGPNTQYLTALRDPDTGLVTSIPAEVIAILKTNTRPPSHPTPRSTRTAHSPRYTQFQPPPPPINT